MGVAKYMFEKRRFEPLLRGDRPLILIIFLAIFIRIWGLESAPFFDENTWISSVYYTNLLPHPPLAFMIYNLFTLALGYSLSSFRSMPLTIGLLTIIVTYYLAKSIYNRRIAIISSLILSFVFYHVWMSLYIDVDGNMLTLSCITTLLFFHRFEKTRRRKWLFLSGVFLGVGLLSKYPAILLLPILCLYDFGTNRLKNLKSILLLSLVGFAIFSIFPILAFILGHPTAFTETLRWGSENIGRMDYANLMVSIAVSITKLIVFLFQYGTPILSLFPLYLLIRSEEKDCLLFSYLGVLFFFYTFVLMGGPKARYLMPTVPVLAILSSKAISFQIKFARRKLVVFAVCFILFSLIVLALNSYGVQEAFNTRNAKLSLLLENSMFWYSGFASTPFAIHVHSFIFMVVFSLGLFIFSLKYRNFMAPLLSLAFAFNFFILIQSFYPTIGPAYTKTVNEMVEFYENAHLNCDRLFLTEKGLLYYFGDEAFHFFEVNGDLIAYGKSLEMRKLKKEGGGVKGCIFVTYLQNLKSEKWLREILRGCEEIKAFPSNGFDFGYIYRCN
ncbi:MAG: glycosyltransferase family 39 protein [Candidatus Aenigmarchaeota archaeon]|nr:glycosyltransferase family 39 protein [Candidatus Aenigmarchaeota archaeon]